MIEIHIYGKLRKKMGDSMKSGHGVLKLPPQSDETMASLLKRAGIATDDVYSLFLNAKLLAARSNMVRWLGYQQTGTNPLAWDLSVRVRSGDRVGVFGRDMAALVV